MARWCAISGRGEGAPAAAPSLAHPSKRGRTSLDNQSAGGAARSSCVLFALGHLDTSSRPVCVTDPRRKSGDHEC
ncbi:hypothetical protein EVAR_44385_1 [Eumeta japonica]|uniref:Uncharacterized protein n=1 Tax=Eumeta variegata TaxID=151549 RepID=A0A4C1XA54_EUMVA|nr:hypothetical protein EVAR_44385_1 [Eumeta japonica]